MELFCLQIIPGLEQGACPAPGARGEGKSIQPGIVGVLAQIVLDLSGQDQLQVFQRGVVDEVVQRGALVEVAGELRQSGDGSLIDFPIDPK